MDILTLCPLNFEYLILKQTTVLNKTKELNEKYKGVIKGAILVYVSTVADGT
jgi:hypothetical protein